MTFDFEAFKKDLPEANEYHKHYGGPVPHTASDRRGIVNPDPNWTRRNLVTVPIGALDNWPYFSGVPVSGVTVNKKIKDFLVATWREVNRRGLAQRLRSYDGAYNPRHILHNPSQPLSTHAYGIALDFDATTNGYGTPLEQADIDREFVRCMEECGWAWGGRWRIADAMHFQATKQFIGANWDAKPVHDDVPPIFKTGKEGARKGVVVMHQDGKVIHTYPYNPDNYDIVTRLNSDDPEKIRYFVDIRKL